MKKYVKLILPLAMVLTMLAGCGQNASLAGAEDAVTDFQSLVDEMKEEQNVIILDEESAEASAEESSEEVVEVFNTEGMYRSELSGEWISEDLKNQRPIAVMVDNEVTALDHYGVNSADIVYEIMNSTANNRVTRLMVVMKDWQSIEQLGSIRSARPTNFMLAAEYNAILIHDGGPIYINDYVSKPYCSHLSGGFARFSNGKPTEFTEYVTYDNYYNPTTGKNFQGLAGRIEVAKIGTEYNSYYPGEHFVFDPEGVDLSTRSDAKTAETILLPHPHNKSSLYYNADSKKYEYYEYDRAHVDPLDDNNVTAFKNVILQNCDFHEYDPYGYMVYHVEGEGNGYYLTEGYAIPITWSKSEEAGLTIFKDAATGKDLNLNVGKTYISLVPSDKWDEVVMK